MDGLTLAVCRGAEGGRDAEHCHQGQRGEPADDGRDAGSLPPGAAATARLSAFERRSEGPARKLVDGFGRLVPVFGLHDMTLPPLQHRRPASDGLSALNPAFTQR